MAMRAGLKAMLIALLAPAAWIGRLSNASVGRVYRVAALRRAGVTAPASTTLLGRATVHTTGPVDFGERVLCYGGLFIECGSSLYIGDDVNDLPAMRLAGASACPMDARPEVVDFVDIVLGAPGGRGAFRELADMILAERDEATP